MGGERKEKNEKRRSQERDGDVNERSGGGEKTRKKETEQNQRGENEWGGE